MPSTVEELRAELNQCELELPQEQIEQLDAYRQRLAEWNSRLNLTRHTDVVSFVTRDVLDSVQLATCLESGERILDVGTGGGVPGIIVAILRPDVRVALCDSVAKKANAVREIVQALALDVPVHAMRFESVLEHQAFDTLVFRAVGPMAKILRAATPYWPVIRRLLMIKGPAWVEERREARELGLLQVHELRRLLSYRPPGHYGDSVVLTVFPKAEP